MTDFESARQKNLGYNITYGAHRSVHAPHWSGSDGDEVAMTRMAFPSASVQRYFEGDQYNQLIRNQVQTALQGEARSIGDYHRLSGAADYTPQIGRTKYAQASEYPKMEKVSASSEQNEMIIVGIVVVGLLGFLFFVSKN